MPGWMIPVAAAAAVLVPVSVMAARDLLSGPDGPTRATTGTTHSTTTPPSTRTLSGTALPTSSNTSTSTQTTTIPLDRISSGWTVATLGDSRSVSTPLVVIDPAGRSYPLGPKVYRVHDISPDHTQILVETTPPTAKGATLAVVDTASGRLGQSLTLADGVTTAQFSRAHPDSVIVANADATKGTKIARYDFAGRRLADFPATFAPQWAQSADGRLVAVVQLGGFTLYDAQGTVVRRVSAPAGTEQCTPRRFAVGRDVVVAACSPLNPISIPSNVYEFPIAGGAPKQLTFAKPGLTASGYGHGYADAWHGLDGLLLLKDDGAGLGLWYQYGGAEHRLNVPGSPDSVEVLLGDDRDNFYVGRSCPLGDGGGGCTLFSGALNAEWTTLAGYAKDKNTSVTSAVDAGP